MRINKILIVLFLMSGLFSCDTGNKPIEVQVIQEDDFIDDTIFDEKNEKYKHCKRHRSYDFDTLLNNGYHVGFRYFEGEFHHSQCLLLMKDSVVIDTLNIRGCMALNHNLGFICGDFEEYFGFCTAFGSGNPRYLALIRKVDGKVLKIGYYIGHHQNPDMLLYTINGDMDTLRIYDFQNKKDILLKDFTYQCMFFELGDFLKFKKVTKNKVVLEFTQDSSELYTYRR